MPNDLTRATKARGKLPPPTSLAELNANLPMPDRGPGVWLDEEPPSNVIRL